MVQPERGGVHTEGPGQSGQQVGVLQEDAQHEGSGVEADDLLLWLGGGEQDHETSS